MLLIIHYYTPYKNDRTKKREHNQYMLYILIIYSYFYIQICFGHFYWESNNLDKEAIEKFQTKDVFFKKHRQGRIKTKH